MSRGMADSQSAGTVDAHAVPIPDGDWKLWRIVKTMRCVPRGAQVRNVEMLPAVHDTWLHDASGER